jgi:RNA polymerase sigma factor (sigma-70 family)
VVDVDAVRGLRAVAGRATGRFCGLQIGHEASKRLWRQKSGTACTLPQVGNRNRPPRVEGTVVGRPLSEDELLARARGGDADAYAELVRAHQDLAFRTAMLITHNAADAEEAAQDGFLKAWRALGRFREGEPLRPWLLTIVANEARNRRRAGSRRAHLAVRAADEARETPRPAGRPSPEGALLAGELRTEVAAALERLRADDRLVLGCRYLLDLSEAETAAALGLRRGTVKSRTSRALGRLREVLASTEEVRHG